MLYAFFDDFQFSLFDFPHLSSFNACEELDHLIILYAHVPRTHEYWKDIVPRGGGEIVPQLLWWRRPCSKYTKIAFAADAPP